MLKPKIMGEITRMQLVSFDDLLEHGEVLRNPDMDFEAICELIGVDPDAMDRYLRDSVGCSGEDIVDRYREMI